MKRFLFTAGVFALMIGTVASAQDTKPADPAKPEQPANKATNPFAQGKGATLPAQSDRGAFGTVSARTAATRLATLEEDLELLEANRDLRKAHIKVAEVGVKMAEVNAVRTLQLFEKGGVTREEADRVKLDIEAAKAQVEIRMAEMKEVEVKIKHAKKHIDDAKAARPVPVPKALDPVPPPAPTAPQVDPKVIAELKAQLDKLAVEGQKATAEAKKTDEAAKAAADELTKLLDAAKLGKIRADALEQLKAKAAETQAAAAAAKKKAQALEEELAVVKAKLKEIEK